MSADILAAWDAHAGSRARTAFEQAFELQPQKCFGNRQKTHAELSRDFAPGDHLADGYFATENSLANNDVSLTSEVRGPGRAVFHIMMLNLIHPST